MKKEGNLKKQGFLEGAAVLAIAGIVVKIVGAFYKIPLTNLLGPDGIGIYNAGYTIYNMLFMVATAGLPVAISKLVSENIAKENYAEAKNVFIIARRLLLVVGIIGMAIMLFGAGFFARRINMESSVMSIMALSPCLFFVAIMSSYRGLFQGTSNMVPTALSEFIEAVGKLIIGIVLAYVLMPWGKSFAAAGAILGVSTGSFLASLFLMGCYKSTGRILDENIKKSEQKCSASGTTVKKILKLAVPITISSVAFSITSIIDLGMILNQLASLGFDEQARNTMYGYYSGHATTVFNMPTAVITSLGVSLIPNLSATLAGGKRADARKMVETAIRTTLLIAIPCAVGISVLSGPILLLLFNDANAAQILSVLAYAIIFVGVVMVSNTMLQAEGKVWVPVIHMLIGGAVKIIVNFILVGNIDININGAPYGTVMCYVTVTLLNLYTINKSLHPNYGILFVLKLIVNTAVMGASAYFVYTFLNPLLGNFISLVLAIGTGVIVYALLLLVLRTLKREDVEALPYSKHILKLIGRFL